MNHKEAKKRRVDIVVISDIHLGTYGCHAKELLRYMKSIKPKQVILNGDIIDIWQFSKSYWPKAHMQVVRQIIKWASKGTQVHYLTGNHDELLRRFVGMELGSLRIANKLILELQGKKVWFFHGDVFDVTMQHAKWLTRVGSFGYDLLIYINAFCNWMLTRLGREKISLSKKIKNSVKQAVKFINSFEDTAAGIAIENGYDMVVCGHIHHPEMKTITNASGSVRYLNSGDWVENLTALEYHKGAWTLFRYRDHDIDDEEQEEHADDRMASANQNELFNMMMMEMSIEMKSNQ
ncbi:MAG: UDP-2,3-diacylglucosamine diphosphatase [Bacteroidota bacterium]|jgi:UDP-2,3-diacylglucosamine pyrophosphatase LpxH